MERAMMEERNLLAALPPGQALESLVPEERAIVDHQMEELLANDMAAVLRYGAEIQEKIAKIAEQLLQSIDHMQTLEISMHLAELSRCMDRLGLGKAGLFDRFLTPKVRLNRLRKNLQQSKVQINQTLHELDKNRIRLMKNLAALTYLSEDNEQRIRALSLAIIAGEELLRQVERGEVDTEKGAHIERRVLDLTLSHTVAGQMAVQIQLMQRNEQRLAEKIQSSLLNMVPLWQMQIAQQSLFSGQQATEQLDYTAQSADEKLWSMGQEISRAVHVALDLCRDHQKIQQQAKETNTFR